MQIKEAANAYQKNQQACAALKVIFKDGLL